MDWAVVLIFVGLGVVVVSAIWGAWCFCRSRYLTLTTRALVGLAVLAVGVGLTFVQYQPSLDVKVYGLPVPVAIFQFERGYWIDYVTPLAIPIMALNVIITGGTLAGLFAVLASRRARAASSTAARTSAVESDA